MLKLISSKNGRFAFLIPKFPHLRVAAVFGEVVALSAC